MKQIVILAAAVATLSFAGFPGDAGQFGVNQAAAAGSVCYSGGQVYSKRASGVRKSKAKQRARGKWNDYSRRLMGTSRAHWGNAKFRGYHCKKRGIWYCRAIATPCI